MKLKISAIKKTEKPSQFGTKPWIVTSVKFDGVENPQYGYDLKGFGKKEESLKVGDVLTGYTSTRTYQKKDGTTGVSYMFNAITPEYVYELLLKIDPLIETQVAQAKPAAPVTKSTGWTDAVADEPINPEDIPF